MGFGTFMMVQLTSPKSLFSSSIFRGFPGGFLSVLVKFSSNIFLANIRSVTEGCYYFKSVGIDCVDNIDWIKFNSVIIYYPVNSVFHPLSNQCQKPFLSTTFSNCPILNISTALWFPEEFLLFHFRSFCLFVCFYT